MFEVMTVTETSNLTSNENRPKSSMRSDTNFYFFEDSSDTRSLSLVYIYLTEAGPTSSVEHIVENGTLKFSRDRKSVQWLS